MAALSVSAGVSSVASTSNGTPCRAAMARNAAKSGTTIAGLPIASRKIPRGPALICASPRGPLRPHARRLLRAVYHQRLQPPGPRIILPDRLHLAPPDRPGTELRGLKAPYIHSVIRSVQKNFQAPYR